MKYIITFILSLYTLIASAQHNHIIYQQTDVPEIKIIQIDFREYSTLVFLKATWKGLDRISLADGIYIEDVRADQRYDLANSFNMPIGDDAILVFDPNDTEHIHYFVLEFEKIPDSIHEFHIRSNGHLNFHNIKIDPSQKNEFINPDKFINRTPVREFSQFFKNDDVVYCYKHKGLSVMMSLCENNDYGRYFQFQLFIQNFTGKTLDLNPSIINCSVTTKNKTFAGEMLTNDKYMTKVRRRQNWEEALTAFSASLNAASAAYSHSYTQTYSTGNVNFTGNAYGYIGNTYSNVNVSGSARGSVNTASSTRSYDGAAAYAAQQNVNQEIENRNNKNNQVREVLNDGYVKRNTLFDGMQYAGYFNVKYKDVDDLRVTVKLNGHAYEFKCDYNSEEGRMSKTRW